MVKNSQLGDKDYPLTVFRKKNSMNTTNESDKHRTIAEITQKERSLLFPIILNEYNPVWVEWFAEEKANLERLIGVERIFRITHYGSTSVPGLLAKPTVDILLEINADTDTHEVITALPYPEYVQMLYSDKADVPPLHLMFVKGYTPDGFLEKVYHIHVRYAGDWDEIHFRDYLIAHPEAADAYATLKLELKERYEFDRDGYTDAKGEFIKAVTKRARNLAEKMDDFFAARIGIYDYNMLHNVEGLPEGYLELAKHIPPGTQTLLDLGCGTGLELEEIFKIHPNINVTGIDLTQPMLDRLSEKYGDKNITTICASYLDYDFGEDMYDCAISFETMHHWSHGVKADVYKNIRRALKNGGRYIECDYMVEKQAEEDYWFSESKRIRTEQNIPDNEFYHLDTPCTVDNQIKLLLQSGFTRANMVWRKGGTTIIVAENGDVDREHD
jgi:GrpB-like predicted nucleotidyltransferase (UPF0157 family)/SAM-dependent methyltransferase